MKGAAGLAMFVAVGGAIALLTFAVGAGELYGIGFDWGWRLVDSGHVERTGLTPKTSWMRTYEHPRVFMVRGEELEIDYAFEAESGSAALSVVGRGPIGIFIHDNLHSTWDIRSPARGTVRAAANRAGLYEIRGRLHEAVGTLEMDWRIVNPHPLGRLARGLHFAFFAFLLLIGVLVVVAVARTLRHRHTVGGSGM